MYTSHTAGRAGSQEAARTDLPPGCLNRASRGESLAVRSQVTAGGVRFNHSEALVVRSEVRAGGLTFNHSEALVVRSDVRAGVVPIGANHSQAVAMAGGTDRRR